MNAEAWGQGHKIRGAGRVTFSNSRSHLLKGTVPIASDPNASKPGVLVGSRDETEMDTSAALSGCTFPRLLGSPNGIANSGFAGPEPSWL